MANERYEGVGPNGHYTLSERIFTKIKSLFDTKVKTDVPANAVFTDEKVKQNETTSEAQYEILFSGTADNVTRIEETGKHSKLLYNPYSQTLTVGVKEDPYARGVITLRGGTNSPAYLGVDGIVSVIDSDMGCLFVKPNDIELFSSVDPSYTWDGVNTSLKDALGAIEDTKVTQTESNLNDTYEVLVAGTASTATTTEGANKSTGLRINPSLKAVMEGNDTLASSVSSHAEGNYTTASGSYSHAEGTYTIASGYSSHAEGYGTTAKHTTAAGQGSHAEGFNTCASGYYSHTEGENTKAIGQNSHAEGYQTCASGLGSHTEGGYTTASNYYAHAEGSGSYASGNYAHAEGYYTTSSGDYTHSEGQSTKALKNSSHAEGYQTCASGYYSHAEGQSTTSNSYGSHAEGYGTYASDYSSHAEGGHTTASGSYSHAEGRQTLAIAEGAHAEGYATTASGNSGHSEGYMTKANGYQSHAEGNYTVSSGDYSHAEGARTTAGGRYSHTQGYYTQATHKSQHVFGEYNDLDASTATSSNRGTYVEIVGNGLSSTQLSNARTLDWDGNEKIAGNLTDKWGLQTSRTMFEEDFEQLTQAERDNGTTYYIPDREPLRICDYIYPVGAIYMSVNNISPAILFGGTWERVKDRFLLAAGDDYNAGSTGGEATHTLTEAELPTISGNWQIHAQENGTIFYIANGYATGTLKSGQYKTQTTATSGAYSQANPGFKFGQDAPHNNMPPYLTVNVWVRVPDPVQQEEEEGE